MNCRTGQKTMNNVVLKILFFIGMGCFFMHAYGALCELKNGEKGTVTIVDTAAVYDSLSKAIHIQFKNSTEHFIPKNSIATLIINTDTIHFTPQKNMERNSIDTSTCQLFVKTIFIADMNGLGFSTSAEVSVKKLLFGLSYKEVTPVNVLTPPEPTKETALLFGKKINSEYGYFSVCTGISLIETTRIARWVPNSSNGSFFNLFNGEYEMKYHSDFGIPLRAAAVLKLLYVGIGIEVSANINTYAPMFGAGLILYLGSYRSPLLKN